MSTSAVSACKQQSSHRLSLHARLRVAQERLQCLKRLGPTKLTQQGCRRAPYLSSMRSGVVRPPRGRVPRTRRECRGACAPPADPARRQRLGQRSHAGRSNRLTEPRDEVESGIVSSPERRYRDLHEGA